MPTTLPGTGVPVSTDPITTLNGVAAAANEVVQRMKISTGAPGTATDVSATSPLPAAVSRADAIVTGSLAAAAQTVEILLNWAGTAAVQLSGTWAGTIAFEGTVDNVNWFPINTTQLSVGPINVQATTVNGLYVMAVGGLAKIRANMTVFTSGSATVNIRSSASSMGTFLNQPLPSGNNTLGTVNPPALTKGTQGTTGVTTQDLKDAGRVAVSFTAEFSPTAVADTMLAMSVSKDGATPAVAATSYVVSTGKRLRLTSISHFVENTAGTSIQRGYLRMRFATTGGALVTSPLQMSIPVAAAGVVKSIATVFEDIPDGLEFLGDGVKAIGFSLQAPDYVLTTATLKVYVTVIGFEY